MNRLIKGDCLQEMQKLIDEGVKVDMVFCDLPYGTTKCHWDSVIPFDKMWLLLKQLRKDNTPMLFFGAESFSSALRMSNIKEFRYDWVWEKTQGTGFLNAKKMPLRCHENILVFYKSLPTYNPIKTFGHKRKVSTISHKRNSNHTVIVGEHGKTHYDSTERYPRSVIKFGTDRQRSSLHPTQKPVALLEYLIKTYTNEGDAVLDFTMGSGSTGVACANTGRNFIGIELDDKYFYTAQTRIMDAKQKD